MKKWLFLLLPLFIMMTWVGEALTSSQFVVATFSQQDTMALGSADTGQPWNQFWYDPLDPDHTISLLGIQNNQAYCVTPNSSGGAWIDSLVSDGQTSLTATYGDGGGVALDVRFFTDISNPTSPVVWGWQLLGTEGIGYYIIDNNGDEALVNYRVPSVMPKDGDILSAIYSGSDINFYINNSIVYSGNDTNLTSNTVVGMEIFSSGSNSSQPYVSNFVCQSVDTNTPTLTLTPTPTVTPSGE
jgi:hypothetical protein